MYPYTYYPQQILQPQNDFTLIQDRPIQNSFEQMLIKLPNLISQNVLEDKQLVKTFKSNAANLKKTKEQLSHDSFKYNKNIKKTSKAMETLINKQRNVFSLVSEIELKLKNQVINSSKDQGSDIIMQGPGIIYDDLLNTFDQLRKALIENISSINNELANVISTEKRECILLYEAINEHFNSLLHEIEQLKAKDTIASNNQCIENIYSKLSIIQSLLVSIPKSQLKESNNTMNLTKSLDPLTIIKDNTNKISKEHNTNANYKLNFLFKASQNRIRKKKLYDLYY